MRDYHSRMKWEMTRIWQREVQNRKRMMQELRQLPAGDLCIRKGKGDSFYTYHTNQHDTRGVLRDRKLTRSLARKCFLKKKVHSSTLWCQGLQRLIQDMEIQERCEARSLHPITRSRLPDVFEEKDYRLSPMQREWLYGNYEQNPYKPEQKIYKTKSGIMVRSKSERSLADFFTERGVAFRYEAKLVINGKVYYPDFMILCDDGRILIWEHFGLMDKEEYFISACRKLEQYRRAGYVQHSNLICTYEEDLRSGAVLEEILLRYELYS